MCLLILLFVPFCFLIFHPKGMRDVFKEVLQRLEEVADGNSRFIDLIPLALYEVCCFNGNVFLSLSSSLCVATYLW